MFIDLCGICLDIPLEVYAVALMIYIYIYIVVCFLNRNNKDLNCRRANLQLAHEFLPESCATVTNGTRT